MYESRQIDLNRERARAAYDLVEEGIEKYINGQQSSEIRERNRTKLNALCKKLPVLIRVNSLVTTLAWLKSNGNEEKKNEDGENSLIDTIDEYLYKGIKSWLICLPGISEKAKENFLEYLIRGNNCNRSEYVFLTKEAIEFATWLKRDVEIMIQ